MLTTLPNLLTLSRIAIIPLVVASFYLPQPTGDWVGFSLFIIASVTDWLDGHFARRWSQTSLFGRFLDPIADKLLVAVALMMLVAFGKLTMPALLPALVILTREILVSGLREFLAGLRVSIPVSRLAKWKTGIQMIAIATLLIGDAVPIRIPLAALGETLLWIAALLTLVTGYDYLRAGLTHMELAELSPAPEPSRAAKRHPETKSAMEGVG